MPRLGLAIVLGVLLAPCLGHTLWAAPADTLRTPTPSPAASPCAAPESHQFDFWIGSWEVRTPQGRVAGTNRIEPILGGCALQEHWKGARGMSGTSINMYDPATGKWHQTWMDDHGTLLLLDGAFQGGKMILSGVTRSAGGASTQQRITWTPLQGGKVRQLWESSEDGGKTWSVVFDGEYTRVP